MIDFSYEDPIWEERYGIIGVDEVGRGALAGPIVAGACLVTKKPIIKEKIVIRDSKKMTQLQKEKSNVWITQNFIHAIGEVGVEYINNYGINKANTHAMEIAINKCLKKADSQTYVLSDSVELSNYPYQKAVVKGDTKCFSIAAASIIAKVYRDALMERISQEHTKYEWHANKGYGTVAHRSAIKNFGPSIYHRKLFIRRVLRS